MSKARVSMAALAMALAGDALAAQLIEEVVVTSQRRAQFIQDVPLAVSAMSGDSLRHAKIDDVASLSRIVPSLNIVPGQGGGRSLPSFAIRGLSQQSLNVLDDQSVSVYIGDVVAARLQGINGAMFDIDTVEVLRGPQGTLFGRNATGGAVTIRPNQPNQELEGRVALTVGNYGMVQAEGMLNVPLTDSLAMRVALKSQEDDGFVYDELLGSKIDETDNIAGRVSLLYEPSHNFSSLSTYDYFHQDDGGTPVFIKYANPNGSFNDPSLRDARGYRPVEELIQEQRERGIHRVANGTPIFTEVETNTFSNSTSYTFSNGLILKNIIGYRDVFSHDYNDMDGTSNAWFPQERKFDGKQISNELQLFGESDRFEWVGGLYYFDEKGRDQGKSAAAAADPGSIEPGSVHGYPDAYYSVTDVEGLNTSYAVYFQGSYDLTDALRLTAGVRYTRDEREMVVRSRTASACRFSVDHDNNPATPELVPSLDACRLSLDDSSSEPTYNVSLEYMIDADRLVYLAHRKGYRSGGFGARATTEEGFSRTFEPEIVNDIELGLKADWYIGDTFLRTNVAAYYARYDDIQRILTNPNFIPVQAVTSNAGEARIQGLEIDVLFRPTANLELTASYAFTDADFDKFMTPTGEDISNNPFARAPRHNYTLGLRYSLPADQLGGNMSVGGTYSVMDDYNADDTYAPPYTLVDGYELLNVDFSWYNVMNSRFDLLIFATNLTNEKYSHSVINLNGLGFASHTPGEPRRYGMTVSYNF